MNVFQRIIRLGLRDNYPEYLQSKIRLTNQFIITGFTIALGYSIAYAFLFPPLVEYSGMAVAIFLVSLAFNYFGWITLARVLITSSLPIVVGIIQGYSIGADEPIPPAYIIFACAIPIIPWILFDYRERVWLLLIAGLNIGNMFLMPWYKRYFESELDRSVFTDPIFEGALTAAGMGTTVLLLYILTVQNFRKDHANQQLLDDVEDQKRALSNHQQELKQTLEEIAVARKEEQDRAWIGASVGKINDVLRESEDLAALYPALVKAWVKALEAHQGVLYIRQEMEDSGEVYLQREASFAVTRKDELPDRVADGEGQVGIAMSRKKIVVLDPVPEDYLHVSSGLGTAVPKQVVICPLITHGRVEGVLEVASLEAIPERGITYLDETTAIVASTLQNLRTNENTRRLLATSQQQAEELRSQEEEMRQNVEELQATQEELQRKEKDYVATIQELRNILTEKMYGKK